MQENKQHAMIAEDNLLSIKTKKLVATEKKKRKKKNPNVSKYLFLCKSRVSSLFYLNLPSAIWSSSQ